LFSSFTSQTFLKKLQRELTLHLVVTKVLTQD